MANPANPPPTTPTFMRSPHGPYATHAAIHVQHRTGQASGAPSSSHIVVATSSGWPIPPMGTMASDAARAASERSMGSANRVSVREGATALMRRPRLA